MDVLLFRALWLDESAWDDVVPVLEELGHHPVPIALPAQASTTLDDQVSTVLTAVDAASEKPFVVGHSAACTLA
ncbi:hypothetical protein LWC34_46725 [Kibdelosporangium philippinense]|uniref:Alpha/beta hydrolase n=1 Tax=Kibdelosporangium philippinense TaxID=211113 RepID=A0ABS8ZRA2_9PSEU|nr:hypothetical protein [Kibdelosporangium philippinense]MCE7010251.1 hypothetical protein [Kibdelosporangium philippinense]